MKEKQKKFALYVRNFVFGVEDSLVSTVGLLSGVAAAGVPKPEIILTGVVLIFVEAFSMGVGSLLSEHSAEEYIKNKELPLSSTLKGGSIMFISYFLAGFIPLAPYLFLEVRYAFWISIAFSLIALFLLGAFNARVFKIGIVKHGLQMLIVGGIAVAVGVIVGIIIN